MQIMKFLAVAVGVAALSGAASADRLDDVIASGEKTYAQSCAVCHQRDGQGLARVFPPLANSDWLNGNPQGAIRAVVHGLQGKITVNGQEYNGVMPATGLSDEDVANVLTFVFNSWDNDGTEVTPQDVKETRGAQ